MQKYSLHILGFGRSGIITKDVVAKLIQGKRTQGKGSSLESIDIYYREKSSRARKVEREAMETWLDVQGLSDDFVTCRAITRSHPIVSLLRSARRSLSQGVVPVFLIAARYSPPSFSVLDLALHPRSHFNTWRQNNSLDRVVKFALEEEVEGRKLISSPGRVSPLRDVYRDVMDLGEALRRVNEKRYGSLNDSYFLFLTNPVDITTTLFASSSGINPQKVLGVCDNDRTRYITALSNYFKEAPHNYRLNETDRQKLSECFVGFGPHNEWGAITYASFVEGLEYLRSVVPHFSPDDPVALYTGLSQKVSAMGVAAFKTTGVLPDTSLDVVHLLNILFPHSCGEAVYSPSAVKALVFDEDAACYEGRMVAPVYGSQSLDGAPLLYTSSSRFVEEDVLTRENARLGSLAMGMIFDKMEEEGLLDRSLLRFC